MKNKLILLAGIFLAGNINHTNAMVPAARRAATRTQAALRQLWQGSGKTIDEIAAEKAKIEARFNIQKSVDEVTAAHVSIHDKAVERQTAKCGSIDPDACVGVLRARALGIYTKDDLLLYLRCKEYELRENEKLQASEHNSMFDFTIRPNKYENDLDLSVWGELKDAKPIERIALTKAEEEALVSEWVKYYAHRNAVWGLDGEFFKLSLGGQPGRNSMARTWAIGASEDELGFYADVDSLYNDRVKKSLKLSSKLDEVKATAQAYKDRLRRLRALKATIDAGVRRDPMPLPEYTKKTKDLIAYRKPANGLVSFDLDFLT